ncbi:hypothetical protein SETIT_7G053600v2 [Setaria italica]|uniref:DUF4220 domain-containing protein n=1 Tax=Setaria italica TaxID=4555 RepID=A0A368RSF3_SETIT|nr:hypothetical protein SETIT_7G053600v2 [Setaria italica]
MANLSNNVSSRSPICPEYLFSYTANLTASYTDKCNLLTTVPASLIVFILAGLFFNLNLFSGISDVSAILNPKVRLFLSSVLSLFLPVMSYLFSEAKNKGDLPSAGLSLRALLILAWMLLVELLRRKVDEIRMRGYTSTIQRAGRVVWLGSLVFFNINIVAQRALFSMLWILCVTRLLQRLAFTEVEKRSYAHGKNAGLINSYMAQQMLGAHDVDQVIQGEHHELLKRCKYIVMGEEKLVKKVTAYGYELNEVTPRDSIITVGKLLRRRFEQLPAVMRAEEARDSRNLLLKGLRSSGQSTAEALFQVMNDEVNFLSSLSTACHTLPEGYNCTGAKQVETIHHGIHGGTRTWYQPQYPSYQSLLEVDCPPRSTQEAASCKVATRLSKYCAYLVLFHPEILPDNQENVELFFEDICEELKNMLGSWDYYLSSRRIRVKKIMESIKGEDTTETTGWREVDVETTGQSHQSKVVTSGAKLGKLLMDQANNSPQTVWKVLADVWTELIIYIAASSDKERVKDVLVLGGEFITLLWALIMHTGISPPANDDSRSTS